MLALFLLAVLGLSLEVSIKDVLKVYEMGKEQAVSSNAWSPPVGCTCVAAARSDGYTMPDSCAASPTTGDVLCYVEDAASCTSAMASSLSTYDYVFCESTMDSKYFVKGCEDHCPVGELCDWCGQYKSARQYCCKKDDPSGNCANKHFNEVHESHEAHCVADNQQMIQWCAQYKYYISDPTRPSECCDCKIDCKDGTVYDWRGRSYRGCAYDPDHTQEAKDAMATRVCCDLSAEFGMTVGDMGCAGDAQKQSWSENRCDTLVEPHSANCPGGIGRSQCIADECCRLTNKVGISVGKNYVGCSTSQEQATWDEYGCESLVGDKSRTCGGLSNQGCMEECCDLTRKFGITDHGWGCATQAQKDQWTARNCQAFVGYESKDCGGYGNSGC